ncbi:PilZ domain-containing protein [Kiloniella laminariae]|uniref:PilZ domain-containing protein n=1 Tax=Kiloniella laminariae TaxID=454162 RepID=A0ABT4LP31_9PROT|nr:PilZ domain-containing protein [Kiloniella laminariae]MCZ4282839.1 PilZ domain-containing protein [Kiloniella laminariae]
MTDSNEDRRSFPRAEVVMAGSMKGSYDRRDCAVIDISLTGAKLELDKPLDSKSIQTIRFSQTTALNVSVAWHKGTSVGVTFTDDPHDIANALERLLPDSCFEPFSKS